MAGTPFLSRHFLAEAVSSAALIPFPLPGASSAAGGGGTTATAHSLLALGGWSEDAGEAQVGGRLRSGGGGWVLQVPIHHLQQSNAQRRLCFCNARQPLGSKPAVHLACQ